ncbi:hypothetical protein VYU27_005159 [Nannochloropsis oceanica]
MSLAPSLTHTPVFAYTQVRLEIVKPQKSGQVSQESRMFGFGKKLDPVEEAKKWKRNIGREVRSIDRTLQDIERAEQKIVNEIKKLAKEGDSRRGALTILAKDLVRSRKTREKMVGGKAMLTSVQMQIQMQISTIKVAGCMQKSADVLKSLNALVKIPELSHVCQEMAREMEKAGLVEELVSDAMDSVDTTDEDEVDLEVQKVLDELTLHTISTAPQEPTKAAVPAQKEGEEEGEEAETTAEEEEREALELKHMKERLNAL